MFQIPWHCQVFQTSGHPENRFVKKTTGKNLWHSTQRDWQRITDTVTVTNHMNYLAGAIAVRARPATESCQRSVCYTRQAITIARCKQMQQRHARHGRQVLSLRLCYWTVQPAHLIHVRNRRRRVEKLSTIHPYKCSAVTFRQIPASRKSAAKFLLCRYHKSD